METNMTPKRTEQQQNLSTVQLNLLSMAPIPEAVAISTHRANRDVHVTVMCGCKDDTIRRCLVKLTYQACDVVR